MSDTETTEKKSDGAELSSIFAFKKGMSSYYDDAGNAHSVTVLKYEPMVVSQLKTTENSGYSAVQVAFCPDKSKHTTQSAKGSLKSAGFENGARFLREIRQEIPDGLSVGTKVSLTSLKPGDIVKVTAVSKGKGFAGAMKRWGLRGGPETHGSGFHRRPGSIGNRTWPGRVMPGKKFPGQMGAKVKTVKNLKVLEIVSDENVIILSGSVPGADNTVVKVTKV